MSRYERRYYEATYQGELCKKTAEQWYQITGRKPDTIWKRFDQQEKTGYTNRQCLGIDDTEVVREKKHTHPLDHPREMPMIKMRQAFLSKALTEQEGI